MVICPSAVSSLSLWVGDRFVVGKPFIARSCTMDVR